MSPGYGMNCEDSVRFPHSGDFHLRSLQERFFFVEKGILTSIIFLNFVFTGSVNPPLNTHHG